MPGLSPSLSAQQGESVPAIWSEVAYSPSNFSRTPVSSGSTFVRNSSGGKPPSLAFQSHLCPIAHTALHLFRIRNATERGRYHVTVFERGNELRALSGILAKPVQQLGKSPFGGVDAAAPLDCVKTFAVR